MPLGHPLARLVVGGLFVGHGAQKLFGWFGGHGPDGTGQFFSSLGLNPGKRNAIAAGASEAGGGVLLAAGIATPLAGAAIVGTMITAIRTVHLSNGPWVTDNGYEYNLVLIAAALALVEEDAGPLAAAAALAAGAIGSAAVIELGKRAPAPEAPPAAEEPAAA